MPTEQDLRATCGTLLRKIDAKGRDGAIELLVSFAREQQALSTPQPQPIETAPKGKGSLLLWIGEIWVIGFWGEDEEGVKRWLTSSGLRCTPTHWLPLPPPPGTETKAEGQQCPKCEELRKTLDSQQIQDKLWGIAKAAVAGTTGDVADAVTDALSALKKQEEQS